MGTKYSVSNTGVVTLTNDLIVDTNVLKVDTAGNFVGINKTTPVVALDVVGSAAISSNVGIGNTAPGAMLDLGLAGTTRGVMRVAGSTSGNVTIQPAAAAGSWTLTLPTTAGTNKYPLTTDGAGVSSWSLLDLTAAVTGLLPVANGGTALSAGTSGGILGYTATGILASSVLLTANAIVLGGGAGATPSPLGSLGTTTTVLHGNAAGAPTFGAVSLTADVSGTLPVTSGGTGTATGFTAGSVVFAGASGVYSQNNTGLFFDAANAALGLGTASPSTKSLLELSSTTKGFLGPRMTTTQRDAITTPPTGLEIFNTTTLAKNIYNGTLWVAVGSGGGHTILDEGAPLTQRTKLDFQGAGVVATDGGAGPDSSIITIGGNTEIRQGFVATGGQTVFTLSTAYTMGANNLKVFRNGALMTSGAGNDYTETSTTSFTMLSAQTAGDIITAVYLTPSTNILQSAAGTEYRQSFTSTGSPQTFTLSNPYLNNGTNLKVTVNGAIQKPSTNYSEDNTTQFTFTTGLTSGDIVEAFWTSAATGVISYTPTTEVRQNFVATGSEAGLFALTGATFTQGGANLKVYVDGVLNLLGGANDYTEPSNSQVQFNAGNYPTAGQVVSLVALSQTGALGNFSNMRFTVDATDGQTVFNVPWTYTMGGSDLLVYNDGVLMHFENDLVPDADGDYYELNNSQVVFYTGRLAGSKVTFVGKIQAANGDANSVNGISASATATAGKLFPLDGNAQFSAGSLTYAILAAL